MMSNDALLTEEPAAVAELSPLKRALMALDRMQIRLDAAESARPAPIAVVGIGCRLPGGVDGPDSLWKLLIDGTEAVRDVPADRWDIDDLYDPDPDAPGKMSTRRGGFLDDVAGFDPQFFGISPREASSMDPQQRLLLEVAWEALEHANIAPDGLAGSRTGVFVGMTTSDYGQVQLRAQGLDGLDSYYTSGSAHSIASGRLSYVMGLQGPSITIDTACSSSLVAVHLAVQSLRAGECATALAGGVNLIMSPENSIMLSKFHMMAPDGRCKAFDAAADGFVRGEGAALVVLKRLGDALADGDTVLAVIRGSAVNQDGASSGLTAPNGPAQEAVIRDALRNGGVAPHEVGYVEAHGTGTSLGDPIEVQALAAVLGEGRSPDAPLAIGSLKTNVGHLEGVAGVAGLIKAVLVLQHAEVPPHLHLRNPNPHIDWASLPVVVPTERTPWPSVAARIAGVSAFGFSGTNAHLVLQEAPPTAAPVPDIRPLHVMTLSAKSGSALTAMAARLGAHLDASDASNLGELCASAHLGRARFDHRLALVSSSRAHLRAQLAEIAQGQVPVGATIGEVTSTDPPKVAFLFTGQGAQHAGMARSLYAIEPVFRAALDHCAALLAPQLDRPLLDVLFAEPGTEDAARLDQTAYTQPALFSLGHALVELWRSWGVVPHALLGHSVGEYVAALVAGVFSLEDGLRLIVARGALMQALPAGGAMAAIFAPLADVETALADHRSSTSVAAVNGPDHTVISGSAAAVAAVVDAFVARRVRVQTLVVSHAFHSPLMEPMMEAFAAVAATVTFHAPQRRIISNLTGQPIGRELADPDYWVRHIRQPVQFATGVETLQRSGFDTFVEIGPHPVLIGMARECVAPGFGTWVPSLRRKRDDWQQMMESVAALHVAGSAIDWAGFEAHHSHCRPSLPTYPFQRQRHWVRQALHRAPPADATVHPLLGHRLRSPLDAITFESQISVTTLAYLDDHRVFERAILPATAFIEAAMAAAVASAASLGSGAGTTDAENSGLGSLDDVVIHEALVTDEDETHTLQTILTPDPTGGSVQIFSQCTPDQAWKLHATARIGSPPTYPAPLVTPLSIRARCLDEISATDHYALLRARGLDFGPALRGVQRIWTGTDEAFGELVIAAPSGADHQYGVHPALLDAAIQVLAAVAVSGDDTYLPISVERVERYVSSTAPTVSRGLSHVVLRPRRGPIVGTSGPETLTADITLYDEGGLALVAIQGLHLKRADQNALLRLGHVERLTEWLYEVEWREVADDDASSSGSVRVAMSPTELAHTASSHVPRLRQRQDLDRYDTLIDELNGLSTDYIVQALAQLGVTFRPGVRFDADHLGVSTCHEALLAHLLTDLADDGVVRRVDTGSIEAGSIATVWEVMRAPAIDVGLARWNALLERYPAGQGELTLTRRCGEQLAAALTGAADPLQLLFPGGSLDDAERMYQLSPFAHFFNSLAAQAVAAATAETPTRLRVLEIGAGTGGTTAHVLAHLPADVIDYTYTDVSPHFVNRARLKFEGSSFMEYCTLDIEADVASGELHGRKFDVIVAANVLHATTDLRRTFANVARLMAPGALLVMVEMVRPQRFISITFGLAEGWWKFTDRDLRPTQLLLDCDAWIDFLSDEGFVDPSSIPTVSTGVDGATDPTSFQAVIVARAPHNVVDVPGLPDDRRRWLILADRHGVGADVAQRIRRLGGHVVTAVMGSSFERTGDRSFVVDPTRRQDMARLLAEGHETGFDSVVHLWSLDAATGLEAATDVGPGGRSDRDPQVRLGSALALTQALADAVATTNLWLVTRGSQPVGGVAPDADQAALWGFAKTVALEDPRLRTVCLDLDPADTADLAGTLLDSLLRMDGETQVAVRAGMRSVARLVRQTPIASSGPVALECNSRGTLDNLAVRPTTRRDPGLGEVEIRVHATGLNFKDVLNVLGMYPGDPGELGGECAGVIVAIGAGVADLQVGQPVIALAAGCFRSHVTCPAVLVFAKPATMSFAEAAGMAIANITAGFALDHLAGLRSGDRVLIHAGAGGVGLAAVRLAQRAGAEIFATAGSNEKRAYLLGLGVQHVYDSRTLAFADQIRVDTSGEGVDVVLNSLAGAFVATSLGLLRAGGRFLEIGKRDHLDGHAADALGTSIRYHVIDWTEAARHHPQLIRSIFENHLARWSSGVVVAAPTRTFVLTDAVAAFRFMAHARHIGKVVVTQPDAQGDGPTREISAQGTYLITGGLRGLGLITARHLHACGARHLALMGRTPPSSSAEDEIAALTAHGVQVVVAQGDVSERCDVERVLARITAEMPPLRGVFHAAGNLDDGALGQQSWDRFRTVLAAKVDGTRHLDELTAANQLDHFVMYSSIASLLGSPGQANHSAANAYMDAVAHRRSATGQAALSINWGAWSEVGAAADRGVNEGAALQGIGVMSPAKGLEVLDRLMHEGAPQVGVTPVQWPLLLLRYRAQGAPPYLADMVATVRSPLTVIAATPASDVLRQLDGAAAHQRGAIVLEFVRDQSARVLAMPVGDVRDRTPLSDLGLDSLMAVELRNLLGAALGVQRPLPATLVFDFPTVEAIAEHLLEVLEPSTDGVADEARASVSAMIDDLDDLSDQEIDRLFAQRLLEQASAIDGGSVA